MGNGEESTTWLSAQGREKQTGIFAVSMGGLGKHRYLKR
jgi:hypothetical protein